MVAQRKDTAADESAQQGELESGRAETTTEAAPPAPPKDEAPKRKRGVYYTTAAITAKGNRVLDVGAECTAADFAAPLAELEKRGLVQKA